MQNILEYLNDENLEQNLKNISKALKVVKSVLKKYNGIIKTMEISKPDNCINKFYCVPEKSRNFSYLSRSIRNWVGQPAFHQFNPSFFIHKLTFSLELIAIFIPNRGFVSQDLCPTQRIETAFNCITNRKLKLYKD